MNELDQAEEDLRVYEWNEKTILIAEDTPDSFYLISNIIEKTHAKILRAETGTEAIKICMNEKVDLVLMDKQMPELNGYKAATKIKELKPHIYIIAQTAYAMPHDKQKSLDAKCDDYIAKPIIKDKLLAKLGKFLNQ